MRALVVAGVLIGLLPHAAAAQSPPRSDPAIGLPALESLSATRERPLFAPSRRPPPPVEQNTTPGEPTKEETEWDFEVSGIMIGREISVAVLRNKSTNEFRRVRPGDEIDDWKVETIESRSVVVRSEARSVTMQLFVDNSPKGDVAPAGSDDAQPPPARRAREPLPSQRPPSQRPRREQQP